MLGKALTTLLFFCYTETKKNLTGDLIMFKKAVPIFAERKEWKMNTHIVLRADIESLQETRLLLSASTYYQLFVNGIFVAFGPCRAASGYARIDEFLLAPYHREGGNELRIEVAGYACRSLSTCFAPSFVCAELSRGDDILLCTGRDFECYRSAFYQQKTERYSAQRHFGEVFDAREQTPFSDQYRVNAVSVAAPKWLPRVAPYSLYRNIGTDQAATVGSYIFDETLPCRLLRSSFPIDERWGHYKEEEIFYHPYRWIQQQKQRPKTKAQKLPLLLRDNEDAIFDLSRIESGFLKFSAEVFEEADIVIGYTELCSPDYFEFTDINCQNVLEYILPEGENELMSFEPYTCRFAIMLVKKGFLSVKSFGVMTCECDMRNSQEYIIEDTELRSIYEAAKHTFAHNASDIYMDCPSRERAGWLCDSYFTGMTEYFFLGKSDVEKAFLENFRLYENDGSIPKGALPMCYPSDMQNDNKFIPQWNMWYVLEVRDFVLKRGHESEKEAFRKSVMGIVDFLSRYENEDGLLENLPSWNFVEWSTANDWVQDVNYPTNFLYAGVLLAAYELYGGEDLKKKAVGIQEKTKALSFDGEVFIDNAVRDENGILKNTKNASEAGQYYAMLFGDISLEQPEYKALRSHISEGFASFAKNLEERAFVPVNAFIGRYLRMQTLLMLGEYEILISNIKTFFLGMAETTGTLWEYKDGKGSKDHGFAAFTAVVIVESLNNIQNRRRT